MCIRYAYEGKSITTTYYKWSNKKNTYILILAQMCHDAQFDLRVVGREELASVIGNEGFADFLADVYKRQLFFLCVE